MGQETNRGNNSEDHSRKMYAVLDIETTGGKFNEEGITEIAIHKFDGHEVVDQFISLVNPEKEIQPFVVNLTGINGKMLRTAPKFHQVAKRIVEITEGTILVAHNAKFDYRILRTEFRRLGYNFERKTLCTVDLSKKLIPDAESHSLGKLVRSLGIAVSNRHRANGDALATLKLFKFLLTKDHNKSIMQEVIREAHLGELSPRQIDLVEQVPSETGVYYLYNKLGELIFLEKSSNMKRRVNKHFTRDSQFARKIQKETRRIAYDRTGSELIAGLKEYEELHNLNPKYKGQHGRILSKKKVASQRIDGRDLLLIDKGREIGERSAVLIRKGQLIGYGFFDLNHQINNIPILESIITPMKASEKASHIVEHFLQERSVLKIIDLTQEH